MRPADYNLRSAVLALAFLFETAGIAAAQPNPLPSGDEAFPQLLVPSMTRTVRVIEGEKEVGFSVRKYYMTAEQTVRSFYTSEFLKTPSAQSLAGRWILTDERYVELVGDEFYLGEDRHNAGGLKHSISVPRLPAAGTASTVIRDRDSTFFYEQVAKVGTLDFSTNTNRGFTVNAQAIQALFPNYTVFDDGLCQGTRDQRSVRFVYEQGSPSGTIITFIYKCRISSEETRLVCAIFVHGARGAPRAFLEGDPTIYQSFEKRP